MKAKKHLATVMAATMVVSGSVVSVNAATSEDKIVGSNRTDTAVKISKDGWASAETVILVNDSAIPDALTATPLAHAKKAPILLTGKGGLNKATADEIKRLGAKNVIMIGGDAVLPVKIEKDLKALKVKVDRIKGATREETALAIAKRLDGIKDISEIAVVNGTTGLADAVSVAAVAAERNMPIILANPRKGLSVAEKFIKSESIKASFIIGGKTVLPEKLVSSLPGKQRIEGSNRNNTNAKVIEKFYANRNLDNLYLAKDGMGDSGQLIDALAVGALAAKNGAPVLIASKKLSETQKNIINTKRIETITQVGGKGNEKAFAELKEIEKEVVIKVKNEEELQEALKKANANDVIEIEGNISKDITLSTNNAIQINVRGELKGEVTVKTPNADIKNSGTIDTLVVENAKNTTIKNTSAGKISKVEIESSSSNVKLENDGKITNVENNANGTEIENYGTISNPVTGTVKPEVDGNKPGGGSSIGGGNVVVDGPEVIRVSTEGELRTALTNTEKTTIKLNNPIEIKGKINIPRSMTLDLNGYTLTQSANDDCIVITTDNIVLNIKNGKISVPDNTAGGQHIAVFVSDIKNVKETKNVTVNMSKVNIEMGGFKFTNSKDPSSCDYANLFGVYANGNCKDISFDIDRCNISGAAVGVYFPAGSKKINIKDSTITGGAAVGIKGGVGTIKNSTLIGTGLSSDEYIDGLGPNSSGVNEAGEALVIEGNYPDRGMDVTIENSKLESEKGYAIRMQYFKGVPKNLTIKSGEFKGTLGSVFTKHGNYKNSKEEYIADVEKEVFKKALSVEGGTFADGYTHNTIPDENVKLGELEKKDELKNTNGTLSTYFQWKSNLGIGSLNAVESGNYKYYDDGAYLRFKVEKDGSSKKFVEVFNTVDGVKHNIGTNCGMTLQTNSGKENDMDGSNRERADWGVEDINYNQYHTNLPNDNKNYVFYGVIQNINVGTKTIGFGINESRKITMKLRPKTDLEQGTYKLTVELVQKGNEDKIIDSIDYSFTIPSN